MAGKTKKTDDDLMRIALHGTSTERELARELMEARGVEPGDADEAWPAQTQEADWTKLRKLVNENIKQIARRGHPEQGFHQYVYEEVMETLYGASIWTWIMSHRRIG